MAAEILSRGGWLMVLQPALSASVNGGEIAARLGEAYPSGSWWRCRCPVHASASATLALRDGDWGLIAHCHAGCRRTDVIAELRRRGLISKVSECVGPTRTVTGADQQPDTALRLALARRLWDSAQDARGTPVSNYLAGRGIAMPVPLSLRWNKRCWHSGERAYLPAMVSAIRNVDGELIGVHRTYLVSDDRGQWRRRERASLGPIRGGAIQLAHATEMLMIAEGIETCLAAMQATSAPGWAAMSTSGLVTLELPALVRTVIILADHDRSGAGERAARAAAQRWLGEGRRVRIAMPPEPGTDFADVLFGRIHARR